MRDAILHISVQEVESVVDQFSPSFPEELRPSDDNSNNFLRVCTSIRANTYRHRCLAERHGFFIFMGTVNIILFPTRTYPSCFGTTVTSRTFLISFSLTARPLYISRITTSLFEQNLIFISLRVIGFDAPNAQC